MKATVQDLIDAIRKNGYPKIRESYFQTQGGSLMDEEIDKTIRITGACALGQAALNLPFEGDLINAGMLNTVLGRLDIYVESHDDDPLYRGSPTLFNDYIVGLNDETDMSITEIADYLDVRLTVEQKQTEFTY